MRFEKELIRSSLRKLIIDKANEAFELSQMKCPVDTGLLKRSGSISIYQEAIEIKYSAPYAHIVEEGSKAQIVYVPPGVTNKGTYRSEYVYERKATQGKKFVRSSIEEAFSNMENKFESLTAGFKLIR